MHVLPCCSHHGCGCAVAANKEHRTHRNVSAGTSRGAEPEGGGRPTASVKSPLGESVHSG
jgi:hypothetical protein